MRIHPAPHLSGVNFPKYKAAIGTMIQEGLYTLETGWHPDSQRRIIELLNNDNPEVTTTQHT